MDARIDEALALMDEAIELHKPIAVFALFSGGDDSLTSTHIAAQHPSFTSAVHINTGIGVPETREFVRETCKREGWPLREIRAKEDCGQDYRAIVLEHGFPGPFAHGFMYTRLKERALRKLVRDAKDRSPRTATVLLVSGARSQESQRRMANVARVQKDGSRIWTAIIHDWSKADCLDYLNRLSIERNSVVRFLHKSGECLCGAFAKKGELAELRLWYPEVADEIQELEREVKAAGFPWGWEGRGPVGDVGMEIAGQLCWNCGIGE